MKLLQSESVAVVSDRQQSFRFIPIICQIDIFTAKFLQNFFANDTSISRLFSK